MKKDKFEFFEWLEKIFRFCNCGINKKTELPPVADNKQIARKEKSTQTPIAAEEFIFVEKVSD